MGVQIIGSGFSLPEKLQTNQELVDQYNYPISADNIASRTGIENRHIAENESLVSLANLAARLAIKNAGFKNPKEAEIDQIIFASFTADDSMPSAASLLAGELGISGTGLRVHDVNSACTGFVSGLFNADKTTDNWPISTTLLVGGDLLSKCTDYSDYKVGSLFGDGVGSLLIKYTPEQKGMIGYSSYTLPNREALYCGKTSPDCRIEMMGRDVYKFVVQSVPNSITDALQSGSVKIDEVDLFLLHQANAKMIHEVAKKLGINSSKVPIEAIRLTANTSAGTIPIAYHMAKENNLVKDDSKIIFCGFGAGLGIETVVWQN